METTKQSAHNAATNDGTRGTNVSALRSTTTASSGTATIAAGRGLTQKAIKWLNKRGLSFKVAAAMGVESCKRGGGDWISIPYIAGGRIVNRKYRRLDVKEHSQDAGADKVCWNVDAVTKYDDEPLIITEGEFDSLAAIQAGFHRVISVPDGAPAEALGDRDTAKYSYLDDLSARIKADPNLHIVLAIDDDPQGANLMHDLALRLGRGRCKWIKYPDGCKDLNDVLMEHGEDGVRDTIIKARWYKVDGIYTISDLPPVPDPKPHPTGFGPCMDPHLNVRLGDFCVVTGIPSMGKSTWVNDLCCRLTQQYQWPIAFASFEQPPQTDHLRALRTWYHRKMVKYQTADEIRAADHWVDENFVFIVPDEDDDVRLEWVEERVATAVIQHGVKVVVVDPWNEMDHTKPHDMSLTEYTGAAIKRLKKLARKYNVFLVVVAHPVKQQKQDDGSFKAPTLYDISDSSHWFNKADVGIVVHQESAGAFIRIAKSRYHHSIGTPGDVPVMFNPSSGRYDTTDI